MKRCCLFILLISTLVYPVFSSDDDVFAPFVSRLKVVPDGPRIKLTWHDSSDIKGRYIIYRYSEEITESNFRLAEKAGWVSSGQGFYIDAPPEFGKQYYYAVLAESEQGELYELFIPFRNKTIYAVSVEEVASVTDLAANVVSITAEAEEDYISITYKADKNGRELSLYRSISTIEDSGDILDADLIALISSSDSEYRDFSIPGVPYYYGLIDSELAKAGKYSFIPGKNTTVSSTSIALSIQSEETPITQSRSRPLPFLTIHSAFTTGEELAVSPLPRRNGKELPTDIRDIISNITGRSTGKNRPIPEPVLLETDRIRLTEGESYSLGRILDTSFRNREWDEAEVKLVSFQRTRHSGDDDIRSHYYLGQVLFFQGEYKDSLHEFILARGNYRQDAEPWIDAVLYQLR